MRQYIKNQLQDSFRTFLQEEFKHSEYDRVQFDHSISTFGNFDESKTFPNPVPEQGKLEYLSYKRFGTRLNIFSRNQPGLVACLHVLCRRLQSLNEYYNLNIRLACLYQRMLAGPDSLAEPHYFKPGDDLKGAGIVVLQDLCKKLADSTETLEIISFLRGIHELVMVIDMHLSAYVQQDAALAKFRKTWKERANR